MGLEIRQDLVAGKEKSRLDIATDSLNGKSALTNGEYK
jgi:hypothetical protein